MAACSIFSNVRQDMISKGLIDKRLETKKEIFNQVKDYVDELYSKLKKNYGLDEGPLFNFQPLGGGKIELIPNSFAFDKVNGMERLYLPDKELVDQASMVTDIQVINKNDGKMVKPKGLPEIKLKC
jgi:hypothetical protein